MSHMTSANASPTDVLNMDTLTMWDSLYATLSEFVLGNWWVLVVAALLLLSCIKHSLMCWEVRQDKHRLRCCYMRHCAMRNAAHVHQRQKSQPDNEEKEVPTEQDHNNNNVDEKMKKQSSSSKPSVAATPETKPAATEASSAEQPAAASADDAVEQLPTFQRSPCLDAEAPSRKTGSTPKLVDVVNASSRTAPAARSSSSSSQKAAEGPHSRVPSLQLPLTSTSSSDLSFSLSPMTVTQQAAAATSRLLNRLNLSPSTADMAPTAVGDSSPKLTSASSGELGSRRNVCCPRYSEDEQRRIDEKRQANAQAWMEAKRALESTENFSSCGVTPPSSTSRRISTANNATARNSDLRI